MGSLKEALDRSNPNSVPSGLQAVGAGQALNLLPAFFRGSVTSNKLTLPETAKAIQVLAAFAQGTTGGWQNVVRQDATLATQQCKANPTGDILFFATDAVTFAEVWYVPCEGQIFEEELPVASNLATLPQSRRAAMLLSAVSLAGTLTGNLTVDIRAAAITTGEAGINAAGSGITFAAADAVTRARVKYIAMPGVGNGVQASVSSKLAATSPLI